MSDQPITKPNADTFPLDDIVGYVLDGRVRIPDFQRSFRWQWEDVRRLFDSIVRGYPIGSLLMWSRPAGEAELRLGALRISAPDTPDALWVVDGQQRLTSLASALNDAGVTDPRFATSYDLDARVFVKASTEELLHTVPLPVIFDLQRLLKWFAEHPESSNYFDEGTRVAKAIRQYSIPAYIVKQQDEAVLRDIFDRMNNYGKRLTRAEVFSALHAGEGRQGPPQTIADIVERIDSELGFGVLDEDTVLRAILARRGPDVTREIRTEFSGHRVSREFPEDTVNEAYRGGEKALSLAIQFLQAEAGVPHFGFLTYRYLLVVLTRFFAHHPAPSFRNRELLRRWFWRAALVGPEEFGGWTQAMRSLATNVNPADENDSVQSLIRAVEPFELQRPPVRRFRSTSAASRIALCALWALEPRSVVTGEPYGVARLSRELSGRKTAVDIVHAIIKREPGGGHMRTANRCILLGEDTEEDARSRFASAPTLECWQDVLRSHALEDDLCTHLRDNRVEAFLDGRESLLEHVISSFLERMSEHSFEDTPPLDSLDLDDDHEEAQDGRADGAEDVRV